jgi:S-adenosylmethionine synthetase
LKQIGYTHPKYGFSYNTCAILNAIGNQSPDIAQGVVTGGAGDQGLMVGYACKETPELMPLPIMLAQKLCRRLAEVRKKNILDYLGPDGKSQVTVEYQNGNPQKVNCVVISSQHTEDILDHTGKKITDEAKQQLIDQVIKPVLGKRYFDEKTKFLINPTGKFVIGGPQSDTGMTGRKIIVDTYGGIAPHGGGAFSGKDPTKVDRSASYMARYIAKNIVASDLTERCTVMLAYAIGVAEPVSVMINTYGTGKVSESKLVELVKKKFELTPKGMIEMLDLRRPIYLPTAVYGHFGRAEPNFTWEKTDKVEELKREVYSKV